MKVIIKGTEKEIADLVLTLQGQRSEVCGVGIDKLFVRKPYTTDEYIPLTEKQCKSSKQSHKYQ